MIIQIAKLEHDNLLVQLASEPEMFIMSPAGLTPKWY